MKIFRSLLGVWRWPVGPWHGLCDVLKRPLLHKFAHPLYPLMAQVKVVQSDFIKFRAANFMTYRQGLIWPLFLAAGFCAGHKQDVGVERRDTKAKLQNLSQVHAIEDKSGIVLCVQARKVGM